MSSNTDFEHSLQLMKNKTGDTDINASTIITIVTYAMEVVETTKVKGSEQKDLAVKLVRQTVVDAPISDEKEKLLLDMIDQGILSDTIELVCAATKGDLNINTAIAVATSCCKLIK